ncbi:hypothetical protein [uncultured Maribacter sp.]|uniref:hypothetical protein n=1 Tax=uncultured Maribacter sp. TaxID=431308 RepID=UPI0026222B8F|nr:hypothetical protein [uncultured Maribacter sp.]
MKSALLLPILLFSFISCSTNNDDQSEKEIESEDYYNCTNFFDQGNYTNYCTIDTELVNIFDTTIDGNGTVCNYIIPPLNEITEVATAVGFLSYESTSITIGNFDFRNEKAQSDADADDLIFYSEINIGDHNGYIIEGNYANYRKSIVIQYKNVIVSVTVIYFKDHFLTEPCNYSTEEMTKLMTKVLENM